MLNIKLSVIKELTIKFVTEWDKINLLYKINNYRRKSIFSS